MTPKKAVVKTLLHRTKEIPTDENLRQQEVDKLNLDLEANGYTRRFLQQIQKSNVQTPQRHENSRGFAVLPYVKGVSERIKRTLKRANIRTAFRPLETLSKIFRKPKDRAVDFKVPGIVYKVKCKDCHFTYVGESKRSWDSRGKEHNPGRRTNNESAF